MQMSLAKPASLTTSSSNLSGAPTAASSAPVAASTPQSNQLPANSRLIRPASFFRRATAELIDFTFGFALKLLVVYVLVEADLM